MTDLTQRILNIVDNQEKANLITAKNKESLCQEISSLSKEELENTLKPLSYQQKLCLCGILDSPALLLKFPISSINDYSSLSSFLSHHLFNSSHQTEFLIANVALGQNYLLNFINLLDISSLAKRQQQMETKVNSLEQKVNSLEQKLDWRYQDHQSNRTSIEKLKNDINSLEERMNWKVNNCKSSIASIESLNNDINAFKRIQEPLELFVERITLPNGTDLRKLNEYPIFFHYCSRTAYETMVFRPQIHVDRGILFENAIIDLESNVYPSNLIMNYNHRKFELTSKGHIFRDTSYNWIEK